MDKSEGSITIFFWKNFDSEYQKTSYGNPSVFQKLSGVEKL